MYYYFVTFHLPFSKTEWIQSLVCIVMDGRDETEEIATVRSAGIVHFTLNFLALSIFKLVMISQINNSIIRDTFGYGLLPSFTLFYHERARNEDDVKNEGQNGADSVAQQRGHFLSGL